MQFAKPYSWDSFHVDWTFWYGTVAGQKPEQVKNWNTASKADTLPGGVIAFRSAPLMFVTGTLSWVHVRERERLAAWTSHKFIWENFGMRRGTSGAGSAGTAPATLNEGSSVDQQLAGSYPSPPRFVITELKPSCTLKMRVPCGLTAVRWPIGFLCLPCSCSAVVLYRFQVVRPLANFQRWKLWREDTVSMTPFHLFPYFTNPSKTAACLQQFLLCVSSRWTEYRHVETGLLNKINVKQV